MRKTNLHLVFILFCMIFVINRSLSGDEGKQDNKVYESDILILDDVQKCTFYIIKVKYNDFD